MEEDRVGRRRWIKTVAHQVDLLLLEGAGDIELVADAQEQRGGVIRQLPSEMLAKRFQVDIAVDDEGRHAGAAIRSRDADAVDTGFGNARKCGDRFGNFRGRDILAFPAEGVADAIDEIEIALIVLAQEIAGAEPQVALLEHIAQDLPLGLRLDRIAFEPVRGLGGIVENLSDRLAGFVRRAFDAKALRIADRLLLLDVELDDLGRKAVRDEPGNAADRAGLALEIEGRDVAFGRRIELENLRDAEAAGVGRRTSVP